MPGTAPSPEGPRPANGGPLTGARNGGDGQVTAGLGPTIALTVTLALAGCGLLVGLVLSAVAPTPITGLGEQRQSAETLLFLLAFGVALPAALLGAPRLADRIARGPNAAALPALAAALALGLLAALLLARATELVSGGGSVSVLVALLVWWAGTAAVLARATRPSACGPLLSIAPHAGGLGIAAVVLTAGLPLTLVHRGSLDVAPLVLGALAAVLVLYLFLSGRGRGLRLGRFGPLVDAVVVVMLLLVAVDLVVLSPDDPTRSVRDRFIETVAQFHADFLLAPANQVLGGSAMLVDESSQYGVGSIIFLVGWFELVPIGYGTLGLMDGILSALTLVAAYGVLRIAGCSRLLAGAALTLAVVALVLNRIYPVGVIVQEGPLRFGLPMIVVVAAVVAARWIRWTTAARGVALAVIGVASIWSLEAFALTAGTWAVLTLFDAWLRPGPRALRGLAIQGALAALACLVAHLVFALGTLLATGDLPDWGQYLDYLRAFLVEDLGDLTYDFSRFSPGLVIGAVQLASAAALATLLFREPGLVRRERVAMTALAGTTAYGIGFFMYLVDRSADHVVPYVGLPAIMVVTLWLGLLLRAGARVPRLVPAGALAIVLSAAVVLVAVAWSSVGERLGHTALAHAVPGTKSARSAVDRLWDFPAIDPRAPEGERLLERYLPGERRSVVIAGPELSVEILMRSGRSNRVPWSDPWVVRPRLPALRRAIDDLRSGDLMLTNTDAFVELSRRRSQSLDEVLTTYTPGTRLAPLETIALREISERFRLSTVHRGNQGFLVMRLGSR